MKIKLRNDWDQSIRKPNNVGDTKGGHFIGREYEIRKIENEISRRKNGSILISGYRGVGKTSIIYKVISNLISNLNSKNGILNKKKILHNKISYFFNFSKLGYIPVFIDAGQFYEFNNGNKKFEKNNILRIIITRLYQSYEKYISFNIPIKLKDLYFMANAAKYEEIFEKSGIYSKKEVRNVNTSNSIKFENLRKRVVLGIFWTIYGITILFPKLYNSIDIEIYSDVFNLLLIFPLPQIINMSWSFLISKTETFTEIKRKKQFYLWDNSSWNLANNLELVHIDIAKKNRKIVYIIDELDKYDEGVDKLIKLFKNLFTLSDAVFMFITEEKYFELLDKNNPILTYREEKYTYFSSRYFMQRPEWTDIYIFLNEILFMPDILSDPSNKTGKFQWEMILRYLCFKSKNDYFDLIHEINKKIENISESNNPIIYIDNNDETIIKFGKFHKIIQVMFDNKFSKNGDIEFEDGEKIYKTGFDHVSKIAEGKSEHLVKDISGNESEKEIIRSLNYWMDRLEIIKFHSNQEGTIIINKESQFLKNYKFENIIDINIPDHVDFLLPFENEFIEDFEYYKDFATAMISFSKYLNSAKLFPEKVDENYALEEYMRLSNYNYDFDSIFQGHDSRYLVVKENIESSPHSFLDITLFTHNVNDSLGNLLGNQLGNVLSSIILESMPELLRRNLNSDKHLPTLEYRSIIDEIRKSNYSNPIFVSDSEYSKVMFFYHQKGSGDTNVYNAFMNFNESAILISIGDEIINGTNILHINTDYSEVFHKSLNNFILVINEFFWPG